jgi:hypothetical protein
LAAEERVIGVDEAAFRAFKVFFCESIGDSTEGEGWRVIEGGCGEGN